METYASNEGNVKVHWPTLIKHRPILSAVGVLTIVIGVLTIFGSGFSEYGVVVGLCMIAVVVYFAFEMTKHWKGGDVNPGIVISLKPFRVAVLADLSMYPDRFDVPVVKIIGNPKPSGDVKVGDRFATLAKYAVGKGDKEGQWWDLDPRLIVTVTNDDSLIKETFNSIPDWQWQALTDALGQIENPQNHKCYRVDISYDKYIRRDDYEDPDAPLKMPDIEPRKIVAVEDEMISFSCSGCSKEYTVPSSYMGRKARCKKCNTYNVIG